MADKASGVYLTITDNSFQTGGTQELKVVIPMLTTKGKLGLNRVTANTFKDIVGYDLSFNSNYAGLSKALEGVSYADVWRLNQDAKLANAYFLNKTADKASKNDAETVEDITRMDPSPIIAVGNKEVGNWQTTAVKFTPTYVNQTAINNNPTSSSSQVIELPQLSSTETESKYGKTISTSCVFYDSLNENVVAVISDGSVYRIIDGELQDVVIGTAVFGTSKTTVTLTGTVSNDSFWNIHMIPKLITDWTLTVSKYDGVNYSIQNEIPFSFDKTSEIYIDNVDFGDLFVYVKETIPSDMTSIRSYFTLDNGSNGLDSILPINIDTSVLDNCGATVLAMNGLTDYAVVNKLVNTCAKNKIHMFVDAPAYKSFVDVNEWAKKIANSEYLSIGARPDTTTDESGKLIYIYPSVNYIIIFANMMSNYGYLNFPPAGPTYGLISVENLMDCDYEMYANDLKTNRINWQRTNNVGTMMWEQRTTYALNTDLSYIAPVFIVDAVADMIITFEQNFNFRYMTPTDILNQESGLTSILQDYVDKGFLYSYQIKMPTYEEAQKAGRTLTIPISIVVMKDAEVIQINLELNNA